MRVVFAAAEMFRPELAGSMTHLTNGTVRLVMVKNEFTARQC